MSDPHQVLDVTPSDLTVTVTGVLTIPGAQVNEIGADLATVELGGLTGQLSFAVADALHHLRIALGDTTTTVDIATSVEGGMVGASWPAPAPE